MCDEPARAIRQKKDSSIVVGLGAVHQFDAVQRNVVLGGGLAHQRLVAHADQLHAVLLGFGFRQVSLYGQEGCFGNRAEG